MASAHQGANAPGFCVVMAGGRGTRFWPLSRARRPKHLLPLGRASSLLRETCERVAPLVGWEALEGGSAPENCLHRVRELAPERPTEQEHRRHGQHRQHEKWGRPHFEAAIQRFRAFQYK